MTHSFPTRRSSDLGGDVGAEVGNGLAVEGDGASLGAHQAAHALEQGGLAGTVGAEQGDDLSGGDVEVDPEEDLDRAVGHVESAARQQGLARRQVEGVGRYRQLDGGVGDRSEEHTSELQSLMRISYAVFCLKKKKQQ